MLGFWFKFLRGHSVPPAITAPSTTARITGQHFVTVLYRNTGHHCSPVIQASVAPGYRPEIRAKATTLSSVLRAISRPSNTSRNTGYPRAGGAVAMDPALHASILHCHECSQTWSQAFLFPSDDGATKLDLSVACGDNASIPHGAVDQPTGRYPCSSYYRFPSKFSGDEAWPLLQKVLNDCLPGSKYIVTRGSRLVSKVASTTC